MRNASKCGFSKFQHKNFSYSREKSERPCLFAVAVSWMTESGTFERLSIFLEHSTDFMIFQSKCRRAIMVGMYGSRTLWHKTKETKHKQIPQVPKLIYLLQLTLTQAQNTCKSNFVHWQEGKKNNVHLSSTPVISRSPLATRHKQAQCVTVTALSQA